MIAAKCGRWNLGIALSFESVWSLSTPERRRTELAAPIDFMRNLLAHDSRSTVERFSWGRRREDDPRRLRLLGERCGEKERCRVHLAVEIAGGSRGYEGQDIPDQREAQSCIGLDDAVVI